MKKLEIRSAEKRESKKGQKMEMMKATMKVQRWVTMKVQLKEAPRELMTAGLKVQESGRWSGSC